MCGIVAAVAQRDVAPILIEALARLEYRGYDSAGMAVVSSLDATHSQASLESIRTVGKVKALATAMTTKPLLGQLGIAHTRWATHGKPSERNAHPQVSSNQVAVVHNGIIENDDELRNRLISLGYQFKSETDTEVIAHLIHWYYEKDASLLKAVQSTVLELKGAFALGVIHSKEPDRLIGVRQGSPLVLGMGIGEHFIASDLLALMPVSQRFIHLHEGDFVDVSAKTFTVFDQTGTEVERPVHTLNIPLDVADRGTYRHYMLKEIFEQPSAIYKTLEHRLHDEYIRFESFGPNAASMLRQVECIHMVACGTSYLAAQLACNWIEELTHIPCHAYIASEFRYRRVAIPTNTLFITLSQSGETADTLAALHKAKQYPYISTIGICNTPASTLVRLCDFTVMTEAGIEVGVASTKAFTTQLVVLMLLTLALRDEKQQSDDDLALTDVDVTALRLSLRSLPHEIEKVLLLEDSIKNLSRHLADRRHSLFLGRGLQYPVAQEGALKLKEISYVHAEAYPAGELKHGPIALIDDQMPVIILIPGDGLQDKLRSTLNEVAARGAELIVFADENVFIPELPKIQVIKMPSISRLLAPITYSVALQLLAYHTAVNKGTDVDQPRNLAKAVTVE